MLGTVSANAASVARLKNTVRYTGQYEGPDDTYLGLRGLRTLAVRLERHYQSGLAIARWIVDQHHGSIEVQSRSGQGASFAVKIPLSSIEAKVDRACAQFFVADGAAHAGAGTWRWHQA